jgi:hypothetical protein
MDFGYSYLAASSWPDSFPYGVFLGVKYGDRLNLGGSITVYLSPEYTLNSAYSWDTLSAGRHVSEHVIVLLVTADYDLLPRDEHRYVPFVSFGAGYFYGDVILAEAVNPQPGIENATVLGEDQVEVPALRAGIGLRRCSTVERSTRRKLKPCLSARVDYLWASGTLLKDTPYEIHGNLGGLAIGLLLEF